MKIKTKAVTAEFEIEFVLAEEKTIFTYNESMKRLLDLIDRAKQTVIEIEKEIKNNDTKS